MKYALFLGCTIPSRALNYELSTRKVAETLGIELVDLDFGCCGFPIETIDEIKALALASKNLSISKSKNLQILVLCNGCAEMLTKTEFKLATDENLRKKATRIKPSGSNNEMLYLAQAVIRKTSLNPFTTSPIWKACSPNSSRWLITFSASSGFTIIIIPIPILKIRYISRQSIFPRD